MSDIIDTIDKQTAVDPKELLKHFWNMFVIDAFIGNWDRHNGNWGFLYTQKTIIWKLLLSLIVDHHYSTDWWRINKEGYIIKSKNERSRLWRSNIGQFNRCKEANYDKAISSKQFDDCTNAAKRILPRIDLSGINKLIDSVEHLSQMQKSL